MDQNSGNTITFPLDLPDVKVTGMKKNKLGDYIITASVGRKHSAFAQEGFPG
jgi:hypothetical protein